ncbi:threonylcarbamoyl-AMP synthase-like [Clavelina lepadiformis]|uniref:Threonylcarbamoyl-AMP synthase n=1 Tax=Clavelina lepadiformis TaxID=159417 RepID=A0ABP0GIM9_CLALP
MFGRTRFLHCITTRLEKNFYQHFSVFPFPSLKFHTGTMALVLNGFSNDKITTPLGSLPYKSNTQFLSLSEGSDNSEIIAQCVRILHRGGVIAIPTDTLYGVACLAQCTEAVEKLYALKERNTVKPVAICVGETYDVSHWARFPQGLLSSMSQKLGLHEEGRIYQRPSSPSILEDFLNDLLPGPVTIVTQRSPALNSNLNPKTTSVGIRVPDCPFIRDLASKLREPLALTSANISGEEASLRIKDFRKLWPKLDAVVDGGVVGSNIVNNNLKYTMEGSTVFEIMPDGLTFKVLRAGCAYESTVRKLQENWNLKLVL